MSDPVEDMLCAHAREFLEKLGAAVGIANLTEIAILAAITTNRDALAEFERTEPKKRKEYKHTTKLVIDTFEAGGFDPNQVLSDLPKLVRELKERAAKNQRMFDLVRYMRGSLHEEGLLSDQEYSDICEWGADAARRLETYDVMRKRAGEAEEFRQKLSALLSCSSPDGSAELGIVEELQKFSAESRAGTPKE